MYINHTRRNEALLRHANPADVRLTYHGSLYLVHPDSTRASEWIAANVQEDAQYLGDALAVEPRYLAELVEGMQAAGLVVR